MADDIDTDGLAKQISDGVVDGIVNNMDKIVGATKPIIDQIMGSASSALTDGMTSGAKAGQAALDGLKDDAEKGLKAAVGGFEGSLNKLLKNELGFELKDISLDNLKEQLGKVSNVIKKSGVEFISSELGFDPSEMLKGLNEIGHAIDPIADLQTVVEAVVTVKAIDKAKKFTKAVAGIEASIQAVDRAGAKAASGFLIFGKEGPASFQNVEDAISSYRNESALFLASSQHGLEMFEKLNEEMNAAGMPSKVAAEGMNKFTVSLGASKKASTGLSAVLEIASGAGVETKDVFEDMAFFTKNLGLGADEAAHKFGLFAEVVKGTQLNVREGRKAIMDSSKALRFYGDTTKGTSKIYRGFLESLGTGQEGLAGELLSKATGALANMDMGVKAFLGTVGGIGSGQGGALGGALEVEQAISEGRGDEVIASVAEQLEKFSGAPLMSLKEAIDSGQTQQYTIQREMLKTMGLGISSDVEASKMIEAMKGGTAKLEIDEEAGIQAIVGAGREQETTKVGPGEALANKAAGFAELGLSEDVSKRMRESSTRLGDASSTFKKGSDALLEITEQIRKKFRLKAGVDQEGKVPKDGATGEELARREMSNNMAAGIEGGQQAGKEARDNMAAGIEGGQQAQKERAQTKLPKATYDTSPTGIFDAAKVAKSEAERGKTQTLKPEAAVVSPEATRDKISTTPVKPEPTPEEKGEPTPTAPVKTMQQQLLEEGTGPTEAQTAEMAETGTGNFKELSKIIADAMAKLNDPVAATAADSKVEVTVKIGEREIKDIVTTITKKERKALAGGTKGQGTGSMPA